MKEIPPIHQWTHTGDRVLLVKCINRDGTSYNGFVWPKEGPVKPEEWSRDPTCESGGLFGWPWGIGCGEGRDPDACADWIVFSVKPENVIDCGGKSKAVPGEDGDLPLVVYRGSQGGAMYHTLSGRIAWIEARSSGSASATGDRGSASATGYSGSASATGYSGSASATGSSGSASATGDSGSASATGDRGSASATGDRGIAITARDYSTVEVANGVAVCTADKFYWKVTKGAVLICRWGDPKKQGHFPFKIFKSSKANIGKTIKIQLGKIVEDFS